MTLFTNKYTELTTMPVNNMLALQIYNYTVMLLLLAFILG